MRQKLYVGNLPYTVTEMDVRKIFRKYGPIYSVLLIADRETNDSRGFGFVELEGSRAEAAIRELDTQYYDGRALKVRIATGKDPKRIYNRAIRRRELIGSLYGANAHRYQDAECAESDGHNDFITYHRYKLDGNKELVYCGAERHLP